MTEPEPAAQPQQPEWAWAQRARATAVVETEPLEYHRLLRGTARYRWWRPLLLLLIAGAYFGVLTIVVTLISIPLLMMFDPQYATDLAMGDAEILDTQRPISVLIAMLSIIIMIPAVLLAMLTLGMRPLGRVWSVAARMRWGLLLRMFGAALLAVVVMNAVGILIGLLLEPAPAVDPSAGGREFDVGAALVSLVLVLLLVPFQSIAEELVFRGFFMQILGSWLRNPWWAIGITSVAFAAGHIYDIWGLAAVGLLGLVAAWLTWRTGGLEAAIGIHIANNLIVFALMTSGLAGSTAQTTDGGSPAGLVGEVVGLGLFVWLALKIFAKGGHGRTRIDLIEVPVPAAAISAEHASSGAPEPRETDEGTAAPRGPDHG